MLKGNGKVDEGIIMLEELEVKSEEPKTIYVAIGNLISAKGESHYPQALDYFVKAFEYDHNDKALCNHIVKLCTRLGKPGIANKHMVFCN